ncbi:uncharacterized protein LOC108674263 isoform X2 [Hyalella azteca]|uniref:Uncharacterized protein LOC108674263 isoform X2 n=1 Tax=Hyalella azteca TaxID=294128 RepID=A0A8B7NVE2_HYAAZ|nr:uncharacterized protein LOC108674263 isoform X2 [Hyalella azteca]
MSRFFSFIKKKGDKDGGEFPASPPPSPLAKSKSEGEGKSVKQVKKRSNKRERHKRPAGPSAPSEDGSSLETEPVELISTDANGNSMTGKIKSTSNSNAGEMVLKITAEGECDSLGDVDSISEEEIANGKVNRTNISSSAPQEDESVVENENQDGIIIEDGCRINIDVTVNGHGNIHESAVTKVSFSGTNDDSLVDDFMDEAFDDLEVEVEIKEETSVLSTSECNGDENEQSKVLASSSPAEKYSDSPNEPMKVDVDDIPSVVLRPLSTDTAVTHYSSCEPGSDVFDSASDEFHDAPDVLNSSGFPSDTIQLSSDILAEPSVEYADDVGDIHNSEDVSLDLRTNYTPKDLEFCFEVPSKGRTSFLAGEIIEARNQIEVDIPTVISSESAQPNNINASMLPDDGINDGSSNCPVSTNHEFPPTEKFSSNDDCVIPESDSVFSPTMSDCETPEDETPESKKCVVICDVPSFQCDPKDFSDRPTPVESVDNARLDSDPSSPTTTDVNDVCCGVNLVCDSKEADFVEVLCEAKDTIETISLQGPEAAIGQINADEAHTVDSSKPETASSNGTTDDNLFCRDDSIEKNVHVAVEAAPNATVDLSVVAESDISGVADHRAESRAISTPILNGSLISFSCDVSADAGDAPTEPQPNDRKRSSTCASEDSSQRSSRSSFKQQMSLEDELSKYDDKMIKEEAEARLAQRRAARAEARELRLRELEKQQQQNPENNDDASDVSDGGSGGRSSSTRATSAAATACTNSVAGHHHTPGTVPPPPPLPQYTRHSSEESNPDDPASSKDLRELEEKFRGAMISNAQLDNEKTQLTYQVELLKDVRADITEQLTQLKKEHKKKCSEHEQLRKVYAKLQEESRKLRRVLEQRDELIQEYGLVVVGGVAEEDEEDDEADEDLVAREETEDGLVLPRPVPMKRVLLSQEAAEILEKGAAKGSLEWRLRRVVEHKRELEDELRRVNLELEEQVNNQRLNNCLDSNIQKEANKTVNEYKFRVQRAEAEVSSLQANVNRLEVLVTRYKTQVEELEKSEEELKVEKRKLQRERRELQEKSDELESSKNYIKRQYEKLLHDRQGARH